MKMRMGQAMLVFSFMGLFAGFLPGHAPVQPVSANAVGNAAPDERADGKKGAAPEQEETVLILYDPTEENVSKIVGEIQKRIGGEARTIPSAVSPQGSAGSYGEDARPFEEYELILLGGDGKNGKLSEAVSSFLDESDFAGAKLSPFWLSDGVGKGDEKAGEDYEAQFRQMAGNARFLPGAGFCWSEQSKKDELARMDGWLTTVCTQKP